MMKRNYSDEATNNDIKGGNEIMMSVGMETLEKFATVVMEKVRKRYPDADITIREVRKNNGLTLHGLVIRDQNFNIAPSIYVDRWYEDYREGKTMDDIVAEIVDVYEKNRICKDFDIDSINDFEALKDKICFKLVNRELNKELLTSIPFIEYYDLAIIFYVLISNDATGMATVTIKNEMIENWEITDVNQLFEIAKDNTQRLFHGCVSNMIEVLMGIMYGATEDYTDDIFSMNVYEDSVAPMFVATNSQKMHGSAVMLYDGLLEAFAQKVAGSFYILPSSVHELIFLPCNDMDPQVLLQMVGAINLAEVSPEEVLSSHIYRYDAVEGQIEMI